MPKHLAIWHKRSRHCHFDRLNPDMTAALHALQEIAELKLPDLNCTKIAAAMNIVEGTAKNMGIKVVEA